MQGNNGSIASIIALVCGILGFLGLLLMGIPLFAILFFFISIVGVILGGVGMSQSKAATGNVNGLAIAGLVVSIIGAFFGLIGAACGACACIGWSRLGLSCAFMGCLSPEYQEVVNVVSGFGSLFA